MVAKADTPNSRNATNACETLRINFFLSSWNGFRAAAKPRHW
jgi:hypothetical protein